MTPMKKTKEREGILKSINDILKRGRKQEIEKYKKI
jgi:hypothetical protein